MIVLSLCCITTVQGHLGWQRTGAGVYNQTAMTDVKTETQQITSVDDSYLEHHVNSPNTFSLKVNESY